MRPPCDPAPHVAERNNPEEVHISRLRRPPAFSGLRGRILLEPDRRLLADARAR